MNGNRLTRLPDWFSPGRFAWLLGLLVVASFPNEAVGVGTFFFRDFGYFTAPLAYHHRASFWAGDPFPLWNPLSNCGAPFLAQWNTLTLYPGSLIYLLLPMPWSLNAFQLAHMVLGGAGMYFLAYQWTGSRRAAALAGVAFAFNGMLLDCLMWSNYIASYAWMPWTVWCVEQAWRYGGRRLAPAILVGSLQMLSGTPEIILFTWLLLLGLFLAQATTRFRAEGWTFWMRAGFRFVMVVAGVSALSAVQLLPFLELLARSQRSAGFGDGEWAMPPWGWANLILPLFHTFSAHQGVHFQPTQFWTSSYYPGIAVVALSLWAVVQGGSRRVAFLAAGVLVCLTLALGDAGKVHRWLREGLPIAGFMRFPIKFILLPALLLPLLAAFGFSQWERLSADEQRRRRRSVLRLVIGLLVSLAILSGWALMRPWPDEQPWKTVGNGFVRGVFLLLTMGALGLWTAGNHGGSFWKRNLVALAPLLLIWLDVLSHAPSQNPTASQWVFDADVQQLRTAPRPGVGRVMISAQAHAVIKPASIADPNNDFVFKRQALFDNVNLLDGIPKVDGMYSLFLREHDHIRTLLYGATNILRPRLMDFLGVTHTTAPGELTQWETRPTALALVTIGQAVTERDEASTLESIAGDAWEPARTVFVPPGCGVGERTFQGDQARITRQEFGVHRLELDAVSAAPTMVVVAQSFHPNWVATVDGRPAPVLRANHAFQAIPIPAGSSRVVVRYVDSRFQLGARISALAWLALLGVLLWNWRHPSALAETIQ